MNGAIELSDSTYRPPLRDDNELMKISKDDDDEGDWDEDSMSDTGTECSCSSCSTCSFCDLCDGPYEEGGVGNDLYPSDEDWEGEEQVYQNGIDCYNPLQHRNPPISITYTDSSSSEKSNLKPGTRSSKDRGNSTLRLEQQLKPNSSYHMDSSGSDRDMPSSVTSSLKSKRSRTLDSSSEISSSEHSGSGIINSVNKKKPSKKKKVTFVETSLWSGHNATVINDRLSKSGSSAINPSLSLYNGGGYSHSNGLPVVERTLENGIPFITEGLENGVSLAERVPGNDVQKRRGNGLLVDKRERKRNHLRSANLNEIPLTHLDNGNELTSEYIRLRSVLKTIDPYKLHSLLRHQLKTKDPRMVSALGSLLPKRTFTTDTVHCVRCHNEYSPQFGTTRCKLPHPEGAILKVSHDSEGANYRCSVCGHEFRLIGSWDDKMNIEQHSGFCFVGVHTPCPDEVVYAPKGSAKCCEDKGCIVFYV